jgi:hypothetical protein
MPGLVALGNWWGGHGELPPTQMGSGGGLGDGGKANPACKWPFGVAPPETNADTLPLLPNGRSFRSHDRLWKGRTAAVRGASVTMRWEPRGCMAHDYKPLLGTVLAPTRHGGNHRGG